MCTPRKKGPIWPCSVGRRLIFTLRQHIRVHGKRARQRQGGRLHLQVGEGGLEGSNVVKVSHITAGLKRFTSGLRQVMDRPALPSSDAIAAKYSELKAMNDTELRAQLPSFGTHLAKQNADPLDEKLSVPCSTTRVPRHAQAR